MILNTPPGILASTKLAKEISDEDDCGKVGDVAENLQQSGIMGEVCYYASKGIGPDGSLDNNHRTQGK
jgi:hypothetical protein